MISRIPQANTDKYIDEAKKNKRKKQIISPLFLIHNKSEYFTFLVWPKIKNNKIWILKMKKEAICVMYSKVNENVKNGNELIKQCSRKKGVKGWNLPISLH
ncbi:hypothetical protein BUW91_02435 [Priestia megaterium]|nr:hypothetical protein AZK53_02255 [Priestia megaterium]AQU72266.1 hypothetical protein BUW91_02435 [Priestia megaterium]